MRDLADSLQHAADKVAAIDRTVTGLAVSPSVFAADEAGMPGRLGTRLHEHWAAVLSARGHEAAWAAGRLRELAAAVASTQDGYASVDAAVADRIERSAP